MSAIKRIIVFIVVVASFFSNVSAAADNNLTGRARLLVMCVEAHLKDLRQQLTILDMREGIALSVLDSLEKVEEIRREKGEVKKLELEAVSMLEEVIVLSQKAGEREK